jgi:hypothetical protein
VTGAAVEGVVGLALAEGAGEPDTAGLPDGAAVGAGLAVGTGVGVAGPGVAGRGDFDGPDDGGTQLGAAVGLKTSLQVNGGRDAFA